MQEIYSTLKKLLEPASVKPQAKSEGPSAITLKKIMNYSESVAFINSKTIGKFEIILN